MKTCAWLVEFDECCDKLCEGDTDYCGTHNRMMRKAEEQEKKDAEKLALKLSKKREPRAKPRPVSKKREEINKEYFKLVEQFKNDNPECKAKVSPLCTGYTEDPHHTRGRGEYLLDVSTWLPVCRNCHIWIGDNTAEAMKRGLSFSRLSTNQTI